MDGLHDMMQTIVHFFGFPAEVLCVLGHLEARSSHTTGVNRLTRRKEDAVMLEIMDSARLAAHVRNLTATPTTVCFQFLRIILTQLVLESTRQRDVARDRPCFLTLGKYALTRELIRHVLYFIAVRRTHNEHVINHFLGDTILDGYYTVRTGDSNHLCTQLNGLGSSAPSHVTET